MPRVYITKYDTDGAGKIGLYGAYDDKINYWPFNVSIDVDVANPIKNQIDKQTVADFVNNNFHPQTNVTVGEIELIS